MSLILASARKKKSLYNSNMHKILSRSFLWGNTRRCQNLALARESVYVKEKEETEADNSARRDHSVSSKSTFK